MHNPDCVKITKKAEDMTRDEAIAVLKDFAENRVLSWAPNGSPPGFVLLVDINDTTQDNLARAERELENPFLPQPFEEKLNEEMVNNDMTRRIAGAKRSTGRYISALSGGVGLAYAISTNLSTPAATEKCAHRLKEFTFEGVCLLGVVLGVHMCRTAARTLAACAQNDLELEKQQAAAELERADLLERVKKLRAPSTI